MSIAKLKTLSNTYTPLRLSKYCYVIPVPAINSKKYHLSLQQSDFLHLSRTQIQIHKCSPENFHPIRWIPAGVVIFFDHSCIFSSNRILCKMQEEKPEPPTENISRNSGNSKMIPLIDFRWNFLFLNINCEVGMSEN